MDLHIPFRVSAAEDADAEELYDLALDLEAELRHSDAREVRQVRSEDAEAGAKSSDALTVGQLLVVVAPAALPGVLALVEGWLTRRRDQRIRVKLGDAEVEVPRGASPEELRAVVEIATEAGERRARAADGPG